MLESSPVYRVIYRHHGQAVKIGTLTEVPAHFRALDLFLTRLLQGGIHRGELFLVEDTTGKVVARRTVRPRRGR